jgi:hypothetical protein
VHLIALERDPYATIVSFRNRCDFWDTADRWLWYLDPEYPRNLVSSRELFAKGINGLCLWYILEIRARAERYQRLLARESRIVFHRFRLEELRLAAGAARLLRAPGDRGRSGAGPAAAPAECRPAACRDRCRRASIDPAIDRLSGAADASPGRRSVAHSCGALIPAARAAARAARYSRRAPAVRSA